MRSHQFPVSPERRDFLRLSLAGSLSLAALGFGAGLSGCSRKSVASAAGYRWLNAEDLVFMRTLIAGVAGPALSPGEAGRAEIEEGLRRADLSLSALGAPAQAEVRKLFDLLHWAPFRRFAGGVSRAWADADAQDAQTLLLHLRDSRFGLLNGAYRALSKIGSSVFWSQPASNAFSHYPGPPAWAVTALNA